MNYKLMTNTLTALFMVLTIPNALADNDKKYYIGIGTGSISGDESISKVSNTVTLDNASKAHKIFMGVNLNRIFSLEGQYLELDKSKLSVPNGASFTVADVTYTATSNLEAEVKLKTFGASLVFNPPVNQKSIVKPFVKLGYHKWKQKGKVKSGSVSANVDVKGSGLMYGFGIFSDISKTTKVKVELEGFDVSGDYVGYTSLGVQYNF